MRNYRVEVRIFALLLFALISTFLLGVGIRASELDTKILGIQIFIAGPSAVFPILLLIFHLMGLFTLGIPADESDVINHPIENLTAEEIDTMLDRLEFRGRALGRRAEQLKAAKAALSSNAAPEAVHEAMGIRATGRPGTE